MDQRKSTLEALRNLRQHPDCRASHLLFYIPYTALIVAYLVAYRTTFPLPFDGKLAFVALGAVGVAAIILREALFGRWNARTVGLFAIVAILCASALFAQWPALAVTCLFAFNARNLNIKHVLVVSIAAIGSVLLVTAICAFAGIVPNHIQNPRNAYSAARFLLGFENANTPALMAFGICSAYLAMRGHELRLGDLAAVVAVGILMYALTRSRTMLLCTAVLVVLAFAARKLPAHVARHHITTVAVACFMPILALVSIALVVAYNPDSTLLAHANYLLSDRIEHGHAAFEATGITLFGQNVRTFTDRPLDCFYASLLLNGGVVSTIAFIGLYSYACACALHRMHPVVTAVLMALAVYALSETGVMHFYYAPAIMYLSCVWLEPRTHCAKQ